MSRSVTMPASCFPSSTTTDEMPCVRISFATSAKESRGTRGLHVRMYDLADEHRSSSCFWLRCFWLALLRCQPTTGPRSASARCHDAAMAKSTYVANVGIAFDGKKVRSARGSSRAEGTERVGAHPRSPKGARDAQAFEGEGEDRAAGPHRRPRAPPVRRRGGSRRKATGPHHPRVRGAEGYGERQEESGRGCDHRARPGRTGGASIDVARAVAGGHPGP